ncbi:hypothetical protein GGTG_02127 [Gaeumannomyces tritici R3-111a-1]|uniref:C6 transcription factor n=1 Tax=Gaeumannomyces tritici (strain R3-111a-1) TaxID=644352 RepID=J3NLH8_GAET3|nr:hypothetical protein GGTG_02127 [Gaeumannomyces tritici R3-111a-1]EJT82153.1 hypothetical protein GGTG_02127 [Gaeumannomyces tritici R3-111a-1]
MVQTRSGSVARATPPPPATRSSPTAATTTKTTATTTTTTPHTATIISHTPSTATLAWLAVSLPLVAWDTGYILLRPRSMPGGDLHWPLWVPYDLYGRVDHIYGFKQWHLNNGFTAAQGSLNIIESLMYLYYLYVWSSSAAPAGSGARAAVTGRPAARAVLVLFSALVMTLSKTILYWLNESWSGFDNIGHNTARDVCFLWVVPNGLWIIFPGYLIYKLGTEIMEDLVPSSTRTSFKTE